MKMRLIPQTKLGKWAVMLAAAWPVLTILGSFLVNAVYPGKAAGNGIIDDLRVRPILAVTMLLGLAAGAASFPASLIAIFRQGERSALAFLAAILGLFLAALLIGEVFIEH